MRKGTGRARQGRQPRASKGPSPRSGSGGGGSGGRWLLGLCLLLGAFIAYEYVTLPDPAPLRRDNPKSTALIDQRAVEAKDAGKKARRKQTWVGLAAVSKYATAAVILSEDARFYQHGGIDQAELEKALEEAWEKRQLGRGASTLTQQLAKNLWLSTDRSLLRKAKEFVLAHRLEQAMPKNRILTLYLNVAEWGDGVYGIEAGAREYFGVSAAKVTPAQAAILAAMLPAPRKRTPDSKSPALRRRAHWVLEQMQYVRRITPEQAEVAHREVEQLLGWEKPDDGAVADGLDEA